VIALLVSPDYASHYLPLSAIGQELRAQGAHVVVATGTALQARVIADGFEHRPLALGTGSNEGLIRPEDQSPAEAEQLAAFFAATRQGAIATLRHQAERRLQDLLWEPAAVTQRLAEILDELDPDVVVSDQLAYGASLALRALERPYASLLPGHPTALPGPGEVFGLPPYFPAAIRVEPEELAAHRRLCLEVSNRFAAEFRRTLLGLNPRAVPPPDPFAAGSPWLTLISYPARLAAHRPPLAGARYIGSCVRSEPVEPFLEAEIAALPWPRVYVSLGSFMSERTDVLQRIAAAFRDERLSTIIASGVTEPERLAPHGVRQLVRPYLPQVGVLRSCDLVVCHGGNNTVTEALHAGVPLLLCPFSTDQFAGAADVRRAGLGDVFDPNLADPGEIARRAGAILRDSSVWRAAVLGRALRASPGAALAADFVLEISRPNRARRRAAIDGRAW
jgi:UDP:flavonoid glycosyltransferase YjiC (YdhE family)